MPRKSSRIGQAPEWSAALRNHRERAGLSRAALASKAGVSEAAVKAFEWGTRHPKEATLNAIIGALGLTREQANPLREANGYAEDWWAILHQRFVPGALDLQAEVDRCPWPAFVANQSIDIIYSNEAMARILRADSTRDLLDREERNLLSQVSNRRFVDLFANFDEVVTFMIGTVKGDPRWQQSLANPSPWMKSRIEMFMAGDQDYVARVFKLWSEAPPVPHRARHTYPVRICHPGGESCASARARRSLTSGTSSRGRSGYRRTQKRGCS